MGARFTAEHLAELLELPVRDVHVPEWGDVSVRIQGLSALEYSQWRERHNLETDTESVQLEAVTDIVQRSVVDEDGNRLIEPGAAFPPARVAGLMTVFNACLDLNVISARAAEQAEKN